MAAIAEMLAESPTASAEGISVNRLFLSMILYLVAIAATFVAWVRLTILGRRRAFEVGIMDGAVLIGRTAMAILFAAIVSFVAMMPFAVLFTAALSGGATGGTSVASGGLLGLILFVLFFYFVACVVFAYFSPKLVDTALGRSFSGGDKDKMSLPAVLRLALILFAALSGLFIVGQVFVSIDQAMPGSYTLEFLTLAAMVLFSTFLSVVHGVAYRLRTGLPEPTD